jgi:hypothetical protein
MNIDFAMKAVISAILAGLTALSVAVINGGDITLLEYIAIAAAVVTSLGLTYAVPNTLRPIDITVSSLLQGAQAKGFELAPTGSTIKASKYDRLPAALTRDFEDANDSNEPIRGAGA